MEILERTAKMEEADLVIIGAGWNGLAMAKTYLEVNPSTKVVILDSQGSIGGTWSKARLYPGLTSNNLVGTYEFSDLPMDEKTFGVKDGQPVPGPIVHKYLRVYAEKFDLYRRIRFNSKVESVERRNDGGWTVNVSRSPQGSNGNGNPNASIWAEKLVVSTGLTNEPFLPEFDGADSFHAPIFHTKNLYYHAETTKSAKSVIILGGSKSGHDAAYYHASNGVPVEWIIRESGYGPTWMAPAYVTPLKKQLEKLVGVRFLTWLSPCVWGDNDGFGRVRKMLHGTRVGRWVVDSFWKILADDVITLNGYDNHPETKKLKPWMSAFWTASSLSILNYPTNFYDYVRDGTIRVHIADITHLSPKTVHLSNGESVQGEVLICSTGWKHRPSIDFYPKGIDEQLGLPHSSKLAEDTMAEKADKEILERFPRLAYQPVINKNYKPKKGGELSMALNRPFRLYRFMVPPAYINDRSIGYTGMMQSIHTAVTAQAQALWLTAYFSGRLECDGKPSKNGEIAEPAKFDREEIRWKTILHSQFGKWRYPGGHGKRYPDFAFDGIPYIDMLMRDLGLKWLRKPSRWSEWFEPYGPKDYKGLVDEWRIENAKATPV